MASILLYPEFKEEDPLIDQLFRCVWHFLPMRDHLDTFVVLKGKNLQLDSRANINRLFEDAKSFLSPDLDPEIARYAPLYLDKFSVVEDLDTLDHFRPISGILVWDISDPKKVAEAQRLGRQWAADVILVDPNRVQQETLETIRFAYSLWSQGELSQLVEQSFASFLDLRNRWHGGRIDVFGNGPSLGRIVERGVPLSGTVSGVCNSTIGDNEALEHLKPGLLFCGDPVQHCGVSLYAGRFREDLALALKNEERVLFTQLGYVPYFRAITDPNVHDRIIGIGNDRRSAFNIDLTQEFLTAATANIFTMLVLPVALTLFQAIDIYGCDGMAFAEATKPWSHADETEYMSKMSVTHRVHKGFWQRNYEEEYWAYCRDMSDLLSMAEKGGCNIRVRTPSYVPALSARFHA